MSPIIEAPVGDNRPHCEVSIFREKISGLLDSGANVSVLGKGAEKLLEKWNLERREQNAWVRTADGNRLKATESVILPMQFNGKTKYVQVLIVPEITKTLILGMNFWNSFSITPAVHEISLESAIEMSLKSDISNEQRNKLANVLRKLDFTDRSRLGRTHIIKHTIDTGNEKPVKLYPHVVSPYIQKEIDTEIDRMLALGIIEKSECPRWLNPIVAVRKSNGGVRICLDARELNKKTVKHAYPQQNANRILARL